MMKNRKYLAAALLFLAASCSKEETVSRFLSDPDAVQITATVGAADTRSNPTGDATAQAKFNVGDQIYIEMEGGSPAAVYALGSNGKWAPANPNNYLRWTSSMISLLAYYPVFENHIFELPADQSTLEKIAKADYMTCMNADIPKADGAINLNFERQTALVVIDGITFKDQYATGYEVSAITVHGAYSSDGALSEDDITVTPLHVGNTWSAILLPHAAAMPDHLFLTLTVHKTGSEDPDATLTVKGIPVLAKGTKNTVRLAVGKDVARVNSITVAPWTDKVLGDGTADNVFQGKVDELLGASLQAVLNRSCDRWIVTDNQFDPIDVKLQTALQTAYTADNSRRIAVELPNVWTKDLPNCSGCLALISISAPNVTNSGYGSNFSGCTALETVYLPKVESFEGNVFYGCIALETVSFPAVESIGTGVFKDCTSLKTISLPKASFIEEEVFAGCSALTELTFGVAITTWNEGSTDETKIFASTPTENITLTLNAAQEGISGTTFKGYTFKEIKTTPAE